MNSKTPPLGAALAILVLIIATLAGLENRARIQAGEAEEEQARLLAKRLTPLSGSDRRVVDLSEYPIALSYEEELRFRTLLEKYYALDCPECPPIKDFLVDRANKKVTITFGPISGTLQSPKRQ